MRVTVKYHIPGYAERRMTVIEGVPGRWDRPFGAIVDEILVEDKGRDDPLFDETPGRDWQDMITRALRQNEESHGLLESGEQF